MADILDRTVTVTLRAATDAYNASIAASAKATDTAIGSINATVGTATKSFDALAATVATTESSNASAAQSLNALNQALTASTQTTGASAAATNAATVSNNALAASAAQTAAAENVANTGIQKTTAAIQAQTASASTASQQLAATDTQFAKVGTTADKAGESVKQSGEKTSLASGFFGGLKDKASELIPGLGDVFKLSTAVATGMGELEVAKEVGGWFLDVGVKALQASGQFESINGALSKVKEGFEDFVGHAIVGLVSALTDTVGPVFKQLIGWIDDGLKWLRALGDWFSNSGVATSAFSGYIAVLATVWKPVIDAVKQFWQAIQDAFASVEKILAEHPAIWQGILGGIAIVLSNWIAGAKLLFEVLGVALKGLIWIVQQQFKLFSDAIGAAVSTATFLWDKLSAGVEAIGGVFRKVFDALPGPVVAAFQAVAETVAHWTQSILDFLGQLIAKIPGLEGYKATFDGLSKSLITWGSTLVAGVEGQRKLNDATDAAKQKAADLAKVQQSLGVMTQEATDRAVVAALKLNDAFETLKKTAPDNLAALAVAAKNLYTDLVKTQTDTAATATASQKTELDARLKNLQDWAAAHHVVLADVVAANTATVAAMSDAWKAYYSDLQKIGFVSKSDVIQAAVDSGSAWQTFFERSSHGAEETAQFIQKTYTDLDTQIERARAAGYTTQVAQLEALQAKVAAMADKSGVKLKELQTAFDAVTKMILAIIPASDAADKAIEGMGDKSIDATKKMIAGMQSFSFETDKQAKAALESVTEGYKNQIEIAGTSEAEKVRIVHAAYTALAAEIEKNGKDYDLAERDKVQKTLESMNAILKANGEGLAGTTAAVHTATQAQENDWVTLAKNMQHAIKSAASEMADALVSGDKSFSQVVQTMLKDIEKAFIQTFIQTGMQSVAQFVKNALTGNDGLLTHLGSLGDMLGSIGKKITSVFSSGGGAAGAAGNLPLASVPGGLTNLGNLGGSAAGATGGIGGALGSLGGLASGVTAISSAVSAITGIIGIFQTKGQDKILENIQTLITFVYGQLLSVVTPTLQTGIPALFNYQAKLYDNWQWQWYKFESGWADRLYGTAGLMGWFARLFDILNAGYASTVAAIQQTTAAVNALAAKSAGAISFDPVVQAVTSAGGAIVAAIQALGTQLATATPAAISFDAVVAALTNVSQQIITAIGAQTATLAQGISGIGSLPSNVVAAAGDGSLDFSPVTTLLSAIKDALSQGSLRPNVQLNVEVGASTDDVAAQIVKQLQLAGIIR